MDRVRFITHRNKQILLIDMTNCASEEVAVIAKRYAGVTLTGWMQLSLAVLFFFAGKIALRIGL